MENKKTFTLINLGCKVNSYECGSLKSALIGEGFSYVELNETPDVVIINTCSVTHVADKKSRQHIRSIRKQLPNAKICVMGCYAQGNSEYVFSELGVDVVTGCSNRKQIISYLKDDSKANITQLNPNKFIYEEISTKSYFDNVRAYLKIQDGCNNFCSYCLIPYLRGRMRSRDKNNVLEEARYLVEKGYKEIILTGIHVGGYGQDINDYSFSDLVKELTEIKDLKRITISSIEASEIDDKLINLIATKKNIAKHLHIPLQSGSEEILKLMNRKYDRQSFIDKIQLIRNKCPGIFIATDVIVGFPGEEERHFLETYNLIKEVNFNKLHVFPFSARKGTRAYDMKNQIDPKIKKERVDRLLKLSDQLYEQYTDEYNGQTVSVLVEQYDKKTKQCFGHSENFLEISFIGDEKMFNEIIDVKFNK